jgi:hypothetical protein
LKVLGVPSDGDHVFHRERCENAAVASDINAGVSMVPGDIETILPPRLPNLAACEEQYHAGSLLRDVSSRNRVPHCGADAYRNASARRRQAMAPKICFRVVT